MVISRHKFELFRRLPFHLLGPQEFREDDRTTRFLIVLGPSPSAGIRREFDDLKI